MTHRLVPAITLFTALASLTGIATDVRADSDDDDFIVAIQSDNGLCLDVERHSHDKGANIIVYRCHGKDNQRWSLAADRDEEWFSAESVDSGQCLDIKAASTARGAKLIQFPCKRSNSDNQRFDFRPTSRRSRTGEIRVKHSNLCLDAGRDENRTKVTQQACNGSAQQRWTFTRE